MRISIFHFSLNYLRIYKFFGNVSGELLSDWENFYEHENEGGTLSSLDAITHRNKCHAKLPFDVIIDITLTLEEDFVSKPLD